MTRDKYHGEIRNPHGAMENAKALLCVANHLDADSDKEPTEPLLFHGLIIVIPTLLGLATELALKALHMREEGTYPKSHDLLELFDRLPAGTRRRLEQEMPGVPGVHSDLPSVYPGIREALEANRTLFVEWRYLHERPHGHPVRDAAHQEHRVVDQVRLIVDDVCKPKCIHFSDS